MVLPLPFTVMVLVEDNPGMSPKINCSVYGPVKGITLKTTGPATPQDAAANAAVKLG